MIISNKAVLCEVFCLCNVIVLSIKIISVLAYFMGALLLDLAKSKYYLYLRATALVVCGHAWSLILLLSD